MAKSEKNNFSRREIFQDIYNEIVKENFNPIIICGFHNTGKTILTYQLAQAVESRNPGYTAFIIIEENTLKYEIEYDCTVLYKNGVKYLFIEEVTNLQNLSWMFNSNESEINPDHLDTRDLFNVFKVILSGTYSVPLLNLAFNENLLAEECTLFNMSYISITEWMRLRTPKINDFLTSGGTLVPNYINDASMIEDFILNSAKYFLQSYYLNFGTDLDIDNYHHTLFSSILTLLKSNKIYQILSSMIAANVRTGLIKAIESMNVNEDLLPKFGEVQSIIYEILEYYKTINCNIDRYNLLSIFKPIFDNMSFKITSN